MKVLVIKTSSLGDLIHTWPALTDAAAARPDIRFDWLAEQAFAELPGWHPAVRRVIPIALRRWRGGWRKAWRSGEPQAFARALRQTRYDLVIDAQGLLKSALPGLLAHGPRAGFDSASAREPWAAWTYRHAYPVDPGLHAVERVRRLFAAALDYPLPETDPDYGIRVPGRPVDTDRPYLVFLHATTWSSKHWPPLYWGQLLRQAEADGFRVMFPWYAPEERLRAERIMRAAGGGELLPRQDLAGMAASLAGAVGVVGVDTGLAHLAAAVGTPAVTLYGATGLDLTGALGPHQRNLQAEFPCAPCRRRECVYTGPGEVEPACYASLPPALVWQALREVMRA